MENINLFLFLLFFIFCVNEDDKDKKYLVFNFRTNINLEEVNDENYMQKKLDQKIYIDINIGEPPQTIPMTLKTWQYPTYIVSEEVPDNIKIKYDTKKSKTYIKEEDILVKDLFLCDFTRGYFSTDIFDLNPPLKNFKFMLATMNSVTSKNISGEIGLCKVDPGKEYNYNYPHKTRFMQQLLDNKLISKKIFGFVYDTEYEGKIIFGDYSDYMKSNYKENEVDEFVLDDDIHNNDYKRWVLKFELNCLSGKDNTKIYAEEETFGFFYIEYGLMIGSTTFRDNFAKDYFKNKNCQETTVQGSFSFTEYYCTDESQFADFPNIIFKYPGRYNFEFSKDELFIKKGDKYIFQIVFEIFTTEGVNYWKIGQPFFRKYALFLIEEEKENKIAYYLTQNLEKRSGLSTQTIVIIVLCVVLALLTIAIVIYFKFFYVKIRRKRVQELSDEDYVYDYTPNKDNKNPDDSSLVDNNGD